MIRCLLLIVALSCSSERPAQDNRLESYSTAITKDGALSVCVIDLDTGGVILDVNAQQRMVPASI